MSCYYSILYNCVLNIYKSINNNRFYLNFFRFLLRLTKVQNASIIQFHQLSPIYRLIPSSEMCKNEHEACVWRYLQYYCVSSTGLLTRWMAGVREGITTITQRTRAHWQARDDDGSLWCTRVRACAVLLCWRRRRRRRRRLSHLSNRSFRVCLSFFAVFVISVIPQPFEFLVSIFSCVGLNAVGRIKPTWTIDRH